MRSKTGLGLNTLECFERKLRIVCEHHFISPNCLMNPVVKVLLRCVIRFPISFRWYAFPNYRTQISRPLACGVRFSSKDSATAAPNFPKYFVMAANAVRSSVWTRFQPTLTVLFPLCLSRPFLTLYDFPFWNLPLLTPQIIILIRDEGNGWMYGKAGSVEGAFPSSYVEKLQDNGPD